MRLARLTVPILNSLALLELFQRRYHKDNEQKPRWYQHGRYSPRKTDACICPRSPFLERNHTAPRRRDTVCLRMNCLFARQRRQRCRLRYLNDFLYLGEMLFKVFFHPHLEGHRGHGAGPARAFQPHFDCPVFFNAYELDISAISLERRTYLFQGFFNCFSVHDIFSFLMIMRNGRIRNSLYTYLILFYKNFYDRNHNNGYYIWLIFAGYFY